MKKSLGITDEEVRELLAYDDEVDHTPNKGQALEYDLPPDKEKTAQKFCHTGTRKQPTVYKFEKRQRKPNDTKGGIVAELADFLASHTQLSISDLTVTNKERQIAFSIGDNSFELTLVQKRKPKK